MSLVVTHSRVRARSLSMHPLAARVPKESYMCMLFVYVCMPYMHALYVCLNVCTLWERRCRGRARHTLPLPCRGNNGRDYSICEQ